MLEKDPTTWTQSMWALAIGMGIAGGFANWYAKLKRGHTRVFNIVELFGEIFISGFVGVTVFMGLAGLGQPAALCAAAAGIGGHMATRLLFAIEREAERRIESALGTVIKNGK